MKKSVKYIIGILFSTLLLGGMTACGESRTPDFNPTQLSAPENLYLSVNVEYDETQYLFPWDFVPLADNYTISINDNVIAEFLPVYLQEYDVTDYLTAGEEHTISIISVTEDDEYTNSEPAVLKCVAEIPTENLEYIYRRNNYAVSRGTANLKGRLVIPDTYNGLEVVEIAEYAFGREKGLNRPPQPNTTSVRMPRGIALINKSAFSHCTNLAEVNIPESVEKIEEFAFNWTLIKKLTFHEELLFVGDLAFSNCVLLEEIVFPDSIEYIGGLAFNECENLLKITFPNHLDYIAASAFRKTAWYDSLPNGYIYLGNVLFGYKGVMPENTVLDSYPDFIDRFAHYAFQNHENLVSVTLPQGWKTLTAKGVFSSCKNLKTVILPNALEKIDGSTFMLCGKLEDIIIPDSVTVIEENAFQLCTSLKEIILPKGIIKIGDNAFHRCDNLTAIYYKGTQTEWNRIYFENGEKPPNTAIPYFYSESEPPLNSDGTAYDGNYWHYAEDGITPVVWKL